MKDLGFTVHDPDKLSKAQLLTWAEWNYELWAEASSIRVKPEQYGFIGQHQGSWYILFLWAERK